MIKNLLFVGAHPDDLEVMAGGTVKRVINEGGYKNSSIDFDFGINFRLGKKKKRNKND